MAAVEEHLVRRDDGLVLLFTPPFDQTPLDPGYIKGYPPGIRENGGQYTHAALWSVIAFAMLGDGDKAGELFAHAEPDQPREHARRRAALQGRALRRRGRRLFASRRTSGAAAGPGTPARPAGCTARASSRSSASACRATTLLIDPCIPRAWPGFEIVFRYHAARYEIAVENPHGVSRGVVSSGARRRGAARASSAIPLADDGATHASASSSDDRSDCGAAAV